MIDSSEVEYNGFPLNGGVVQTVLAKLKQSINAADFDCKFDGVTDDYANLQEAINAAAGMVLWLPAGVALLSQKVEIPSNTTIYGVFGQTWLKVQNGSTSSTYLMVINAKTNVVVMGVGFDGNMANVAANNNTVLTYSSSNVWFDQCMGKNTKGITLAFSGNVDYTNCKVTRSKFTNCGQYHLVSGDSDDRKDCIWFGGAGGGKGSRLFVDDCDFENSGLAHVSFSGGVGRGLSKVRITNCRMGRSDAGCIYFSSLNDVVCHGNIISGCDGNGIDCIDMYDFVITGNLVRDCTAAGIGAFGSCKRGSITGNTCLNNFAKGGWSGEQNSLHRGGITFHVLTSDVCENIIVSGNTSMDTRSGLAVTQRFAIGVVREGVGIFRNVKIAADNLFKGYDALGNENQQYVFQTPDLGLQEFPLTVILDDMEGIVLGPQTDWSRMTVVNQNASAVGDIMIRGGVAPIVMYQTSAGAFTATDTGTGIAVYLSGSNVHLRNRTGASRLIHVQKTGALVEVP